MAIIPKNSKKKYRKMMRGVNNKNLEKALNDNLDNIEHGIKDNSSGNLGKMYLNYNNYSYFTPFKFRRRNLINWQS